METREPVSGQFRSVLDFVRIVLYKVVFRKFKKLKLYIYIYIYGSGMEYTASDAGCSFPL